MDYALVYVVSGSCGEYSDHTTWIVGWYYDEEEAKKHVELANQIEVKSYQMWVAARGAIKSAQEQVRSGLGPNPLSGDVYHKDRAKAYAEHDAWEKQVKNHPLVVAAYADFERVCKEINEMGGNVGWNGLTKYSCDKIARGVFPKIKEMLS